MKSTNIPKLPTVSFVALSYRAIVEVYNSTGGFVKLQSVLHVQHENKVLNPGLSVQRIATDLEICLYGLQNHRVGSKNPEFHGIIFSH